MDEHSSETNHAQRRFVNQYTSDGSSSGPVNFLSIDNAKRRVGGRADTRNLDALRDARARDENEFVFCLGLRRILADNPTRVGGTSQQGRYAKQRVWSTCFLQSKKIYYTRP